MPGRIPLDYEGGKSNTDLTIEKVNQIDPKSFGRDPATGETPLFVSYACRTGTPDEEGNNLAQSFADRTGATVKAFKRRSNYDDTFSNKDIRNFNRTMKLNKLIPGSEHLKNLVREIHQKNYQKGNLNLNLRRKKINEKSNYSYNI
ncbi:MAG: hypothetical protein IPG89_15400 [Bacteroidetes bacterium]|nr:hypothetical protein [Bacteroidota bacterium]